MALKRKQYLARTAYPKMMPRQWDMVSAQNISVVPNGRLAVFDKEGRFEKSETAQADF